MMIDKITPFVDNNWGLKRFNTKINDPSNQNSFIQVPKVIKTTNKKTLL